MARTETDRHQLHPSASSPGHPHPAPGEEARHRDRGTVPFTDTALNNGAEFQGVVCPILPAVPKASLWDRPNLSITMAVAVLLPCKLVGSK